MAKVCKSIIHCGFVLLGLASVQTQTNATRTEMDDPKPITETLSGMYTSPDGDTFFTGTDSQGQVRFEVMSFRKTSPKFSFDSLKNVKLLGPVTADSKYLYLVVLVTNPRKEITNSLPPPDRAWTGVLRRSRSNNSAPFPGGRGSAKDLMIISENVIGVSPTIGGIAVDSLGNLYVTEPVLNAVLVYDAVNMVGKSSFLVQNPTIVCSAPGGGVWLVQKNGRSASSINVAAKITPKGTLAGSAIPLLPPIIPRSIASDNSGHVYIADGGPANTVRVYTGNHKILAPVANTIFSTNWPRDRKLFGLAGIGVTSRGVLTVGTSVPGGGVDILLLDKSGVEIQRYSSLVEANPSVLNVATSRTDLYTGNAHLTMASKDLLRQPKIVGSSISPFQYPNDFRLHVTAGFLPQPLIRTLKGHRFLVLPNLGDDTLCIYRYDSEAAIPSVIFARTQIRSGLWQPPFQPTGGQWMWRDANGDGQMDDGEYFYIGDRDAPPGTRWTMDRDGDIWEISPLTKDNLRRWSLVELDKKGNPVYKRSQSRIQTLPDGVAKITHLQYLAQTDEMIMLGNLLAENAGSISSQPDRQTLVAVANWSQGNRKPKVVFGTGVKDPTSSNNVWTVFENHIFIVDKDAVYVINRQTGDKVGTVNLGKTKMTIRGISVQKIGKDAVVLSLDVPGEMPRITYQLQ